MNTDVNRRVFVGTLLSLGALCSLNPSQALAVTAAQKQAEVRAVKAQLDAIYEEVYAAGSKYHQAMDAYQDATAKVDECQATIVEMTDKIGTLQEHLDARAASMYRTGSMSYLDVLLGVHSFDDFATVWDTLNSLNAGDADLVASTKIAKSTLEAAQGELIAQQAQAEHQLSAADTFLSQTLAKQGEYDNLYDSLSSEYQQMLAEQEAAEAQVTLRPAQEYSSRAATSGATGSSSASSGAPANQAAPAPTASVTQPAPQTSAPVPALPTNASVVDYARSRIGCPYVWAADGPDAFDCSGLVVWCYAKIGRRLPHYTESLYDCAAARFSPYDAEPGDVLYKRDHVGISTGGINCIEAMGTRWGVVESHRDCWTAALRF